MLDPKPGHLTKLGTVTVPRDGLIVVEGFAGEGCTCRDVAVLAVTWAIGRLQAELLKTLEKPGGGRIGVD